MSKKPNSRWNREPVLVSGKPAVARITEHDIRIFSVLARHRFLPVDFIHAFVGGNYEWLVDRLNVLSRKPNLYIARPIQQRDHAEANYRKLIYELDQRGATLLSEQGIDVPKRRPARNFAHELLVSQIAASLELGQAADLRIINWKAIRASDGFPKTTTDFAIPVDAEEVRADWEPFVIVRDIGAMFFPGFEADCGTEPINAGDDDRSSIKKKFALYLKVIKDKTYRTHFGANTFMVPFITTSRVRMESMMRLLASIESGPERKRFIFKHVPGFYAYRQSFKPTGHIMTEPWKRAGYPDFCFTKETSDGRETATHQGTHRAERENRLRA